jgi:hypothetical protein
MKNFKHKSTAFLSFIMIFLTFTNCSSLRINSDWKKNEINIDGDPKEWENRLGYLEDDNISVGISNDNEFIYICLVTGDRNIISQILGGGLILWFNPENEKEKYTGIHYPKKIRGYGDPMKDFQGMEEKNMNDRFEMFKYKHNKVELIWPGGEQKTLVPLKDNPHVNASIEIVDGLFIYELRAKIKSDSAQHFSIHADTGKVISLGIETSDINSNRPKGDFDSPGRGMSGLGRGMSGEGRGMGGPGGGMGRPMGYPPPMGGMSEPLMIWLDVKLSSGR